MPIVYKPFPTWQGLLDTIAHMADNPRTIRGLCYKAPLDRFPTPIVVLKAFKNGKLRIRTTYNNAPAFTVDSSHLERFCYQTFEPLPETEDDFRCHVHSNGGTGPCNYCED